MFKKFFKKVCFLKEQQSTDISAFCDKSVYTPTYQLISRDLESPQDAVFEAAVYYLCVIASNKPTEQEPILQILEAYLSQKKIKEKRHQYIQKLLKLNSLPEIIHNQ